MNKRFSRNECERCGAPLTKSKHRGRYVCSYCNADYLDNYYSADAWDEEVEEKPYDKIEHEISRQKVIPDNNKNAAMAIPLIAIVLIFLACLILSIIGGFSTGSSSRYSNSHANPKNTPIIKPQMLNKLPKAVSAGSAVAFEDWELLVSPEFEAKNNRLSFSFTVKNWGDQTQIFSYEPKTFIVYDDLGQKYPLVLGNCAPDLPFIQRQLTFSPNQQTIFESSHTWCNNDKHIPTYNGTISQQAKHIYFHFEEFGVFKDITFVFDL